MLRLDEAATVALQAAELSRRVNPTRPASGNQLLDGVAQYHMFTGREREARVVLQQVLDYAKAQFGDPSWETLNARSSLADLSEIEGDFAAAEQVWRERLTLASQLAQRPRQLLPSLRGLAQNLALQGRYNEALDIIQRAVDIASRNVSIVEFDDLAQSVFVRTAILRGAGRMEQAQADLDNLEAFANGFRSGILSPERFQAELQEERAFLYAQQRNYPRLLEAASRLIAIDPTLQGNAPADAVTRDARSILTALGHYGLGRYEAAQTDLNRVEAALNKVSPGASSLTSPLLSSFDLLRARNALARSDIKIALAASERGLEMSQRLWRSANAMAIVRSSPLNLDAAATLRMTVLFEARRQSEIDARTALSQAFLLTQQNPNNAARALAASSALVSAGTSARASFQQMAASSRELAGLDDQLTRLEAHIARIRDDRSTHYQRSNETEAEAARRTAEWRLATAQLDAVTRERDRMRGLRANALARYTAARSLLAGAAPSIQQLLFPQPVSLDRVRDRSSGLLHPDEALILLVPGDPELPSHLNNGFVFVATHEGAAWARIDFDDAKLRAEVRALQAMAQQEDVYFDAQRSHRLYRALFADPSVARLINSRKTWLIAPQGYLLSLPFAALVSDLGRGDAGRYTAGSLRTHRWLGLERGLAVLPSVVALTDLRGSRATPAPATLPYFGVGDPDFEGAPIEVRPNRNARDFRLGAFANLDALRAAPKLERSRDEVEKLARVLGGDGEMIFLGARARESILRAAQDRMSRAQVVHFATHGLIGGDLDGGAIEPALALSPPPRGTPVPADPMLASLDDGLLTASEIAQLKLSAQWVILSACNTAAGDGAAEGLSGLTRSFFLAGARSVLVSQWSVKDFAAERLVTRTVELWKGGLSKVEALRTAMAEAAADTRLDDDLLNYAHPTLWAPFVFVGVP